MSGVASVEALSEIINSMSAYDCPSSESIPARRCASPLNTGIPMLTNAFTAMVVYPGLPRLIRLVDPLEPYLAPVGVRGAGATEAHGGTFSAAIDAFQLDTGIFHLHHLAGLFVYQAINPHLHAVTIAAVLQHLHVVTHAAVESALGQGGVNFLARFDLDPFTGTQIEYFGRRLLAGLYLPCSLRKRFSACPLLQRVIKTHQYPISKTEPCETAVTRRGQNLDHVPRRVVARRDIPHVLPRIPPWQGVRRLEQRRRLTHPRRIVAGFVTGLACRAQYLFPGATARR